MRIEMTNKIPSISVQEIAKKSQEEHRREMGAEKIAIKDASHTGESSGFAKVEASMSSAQQIVGSSAKSHALIAAAVHRTRVTGVDAPHTKEDVRRIQDASYQKAISDPAAAVASHNLSNYREKAVKLLL